VGVGGDGLVGAKDRGLDRGHQLDGESGVGELGGRGGAWLCAGGG